MLEVFSDIHPGYFTKLSKSVTKLAAIYQNCYNFQSVTGGAGIRRLHGMCLNPVTMEWKWTNYTAINYAIEATVFPASIKEL